MLYTDINELKTMFDIPFGDDSETTKLLFCASWAAKLIDSTLNRPITLQQRTEFPRPTNTPKLTLKARPVYTNPAPSVSVSNNGFYNQGSSPGWNPLVYGTDFVVQIDDSGNASLGTSGILVRLPFSSTPGFPGGVWAKPIQRPQGMLTAGFTEGFGSIMVTYTGGYSLATLPAEFRTAADLLVARLMYLFPHGMELSGDSYEDKAMSFVAERKGWLMSLVKPMLYRFRNWTFA